MEKSENQGNRENIDAEKEEMIINIWYEKSKTHEKKSLPQYESEQWKGRWSDKWIQDNYRWATCNKIFSMKKLVEFFFSPKITHWALVKLIVAKCSEIEMK